MIRETVLGQGLTILTEELAHLRSVALGYWVGVGSRDEADADAGATHFLEHLLFKGSDVRGARAIAEAIESVGGDLNAFTTQEHTAFHAHVPADATDAALEILTDIVWRPALRETDVDRERQVIVEEIHLRDDSPEDLVHELFAGAQYPEHPLGRSILGTVETIDAASAESIARFHHAYYHPANVTFVAAGALDHDRVVAALAESTPRSGGDPVPPRRVPPAPNALVDARDDVEQAQVVMGWRAPPASDPDRYALMVLDQILGGGAASRWWQSLREDRGLVYSVYSFHTGFSDTGTFGVGTGTVPEHVDDVVELLRDDADRVRAHGVGERELEVAKGSLGGNLVLSSESSNARMHRLGTQAVSIGEVIEVDESLRRLGAVTAADVHRVAERVLGGPATLAVLHP